MYIINNNEYNNTGRTLYIAAKIFFGSGSYIISSSSRIKLPLIPYTENQGTQMLVIVRFWWGGAYNAVGVWSYPGDKCISAVAAEGSGGAAETSPLSSPLDYLMM